MVQIERDSNNIIIKKQLTNVYPNIKTGITSLGVIGINDIVLNSIKLKGTIVNSETIEKLEYSNDLTPGIALPNKALLVDSEKNISGLNIISCNGLILNGSVFNPTLFIENNNINTGENYITDITIGLAQSNKALVTDYNYNIKEINSIDSKKIQLNKKNISFNCNQSNINLNDIEYDNLTINSNWISSLDSNNNWLDIEYSENLNLYIAVGKKVISSIDGIKWIERYNSDIDIYKSITWGLNMFIAVGSKSIIYSNNGIDWDVIEIYNNNWKCICYGNSKFVCTGDSITIYSEDGLNWNIGTLNYNIKKIVWCHNVFIGIDDTNIYISNNGINWNIILNNLSNLTDVCFSLELNRIIITSCDFINKQNSYIIYSDDSQSWLYSYKNIIINTLTWSSDLKLFIGCDLENNGYYSSNGIYWIEFECGTVIPNSIIWSNNYKKIIGVGNGIINSCLSKKNISLNKIFIDNDENLGIGSNPLTHKLEISDINGKCLKLIDNDKYTSFNINNKNLTINSSTSLNLSNGLMLNNKLITTDVVDFNKYLNSIISGSISSNSVISVNSNRNLSGINSINTLNLLVNGVNKNIDSNHITFKNVKVGIASPNKAITLDKYNNIRHINSIKSNKLNINNTYLKSNIKNINTFYNDNYLNFNKLKNNNLIITEFGVEISNSNNKLEWIDNIYILINNNGIYTSIDGIIWEIKINGSYNDLVYNNKRIIVIGENIVCSEDGIIWNIVNTDFIFKSIYWNSNLDQYISSGESIIGISNNGINWNIINIEYTFINICYGMNMYFGITNDTNNNLVYISKNGIDWEIITYKYDIETKDIYYNNNLILICTNLGIIYSTDGYIWNRISDTIILLSINYIKGIYFGINNDGIYFSENGMNWKLYNNLNSNNKSNLTYNNNIDCLSLFDDSGFVRTDYNFNFNIFSKCLYYHKEHIQLDFLNNRIGLGIEPLYTLHLSTDNAISLSSTWTISSDIRIKKNIEDANLDLCSNIIKNLRLVKYKWKNEFFQEQIYDKNKLGWIAQEVEEFIPKAVTINSQYGYSDFKSLNSDQIIANLYGSLQNLIYKFEESSNLCDMLLNKLNDFDSIV